MLIEMKQSLQHGECVGYSIALTIDRVDEEPLVLFL